MEQNFITASEIARRYGFSIQGVQKWRERGIPYDTNKKKYPEKDSTDWIVKNILDPLKDLDTSEKLKLAKLKRAEAEARIAEMDERTQAGSLIPVALVQEALSKYCSQVRTSMTQISTTQARFLLEQATDTRTLKEALQRVIVERLNEIGAVMESDSFFDDPDLTDISEDNETTYP
ncbi:hypothetical protein [Atlantibacter hermannii]|uniref:Terminase small subunit n=2 Tax=Atlantibacter hermannii TaxID=565 RepID=H5V206_ATLHE|nr:hypothetical protein [Atlantibacter hermannii]QPS93791.1 hypothetical protein I6G45_10040 [Atlantibacter hermannii]GAB52014.1 hypothetical protein EH105704_05_00200 [Atlantibacter hermannii NBRC 105704]VDZ73292.1 Uncharacterised protein [Atlantibacter hermannii]